MTDEATTEDATGTPDALKALAGAQADEAANGKPSAATRLVELAAEDELFHSDQTAYARFAVESHHEISSLRTRGYRSRLARRFYERENKAPSAQALQDALGVLEGEALYGGEEQPVATRLAEHEGAIYLDLANTAWEAVEVTAKGWRIVSDPPVRFRRPRGTGELPRPEAGDLAPLRELVNVDPADWSLLVAWLLAALRPTGPYPVLALHGEQGSAKSSTARMVRALVDPNAASLRAAPKSPHDLMIAATNSRIVALDNLSTVQPWLSDALCRLATGGGFSTRTLYENDEETIFEAQRPVILNGIAEVASRGDLVDRAIVLESPRIAAADRLTENELYSRFDAAQPQILGALLDGVARGLADLDGVTLTDPPRMADFAEWACAALPGVGIAGETFLAAYAENRERGSGAVLETSPVAAALVDLAGRGFEGTASELLERLGDLASETETRSKEWPRSPDTLGRLLTRLAPNLRDAGYEVERRHGKRRTWLLRTSADRSVASVEVSPTALASQDGADTTADASGRGDTSTVAVDASTTEKCRRGNPHEQRDTDTCDTCDTSAGDCSNGDDPLTAGEALFAAARRGERP